MIKILIGFIVFAALALFVIMKGGDSLDMGGEKHGSETTHEAEPAKPAAPAPALTTLTTHPTKATTITAALPIRIPMAVRLLHQASCS